MIKKITSVLILFLSLTLFSQQKSINDYKYILVPNKFDFLKSVDQYQVNSLTKFLFKKNGFTTFFSEEQLPEDLAQNRCLALKAKVNNNSSLFTTKTNIELVDCNNNVVYTSSEGKSKIKEYKKAYHKTIRESFNSIKALNYKYQSKNNNAVISTKPLKEKQIKETPEIEKEVKKVVVATPIKVNKNTLYAQPITNGFQVVNTEPKVVFQLLKSSKEELFFIKNKNGILFKKNNFWIAEYYENNILIQKKYNIKF